MRKVWKFASLALATLPAGAGAAVSDVYPTDFVALKEGVTNVTLYTAHQQGEGPYRNGSLQLKGEVGLTGAALRVSRLYEFGDERRYALAPVIVLPWSEATPNAAAARVVGNEVQGMGDLRLGTSFWFVIDRPNREYAAVTFFAILPTGQYDGRQALNIGENRYRYTLAGGWMRPLGERWVMDLAPEIAFYGANTDYPVRRVMRQDISYALTGYLRYRFTPAFQWMVGAQFNRGGATTVNGAALSGAPNNTRLSTGLLLMATPEQQWQLRVSRDVDSDNGFRLGTEVALRLNYSFR